MCGGGIIKDESGGQGDWFVQWKKMGAPAGNRNAKKRPRNERRKQPKNNLKLQPRNDLNIDIEKDIDIDIDTALNKRERKRTVFSFCYRTGDTLWGSVCVHPGACENPRLRADAIRPYGSGGEAGSIQRTARLRKCFR